MEARSMRFAAAARALSETARSQGFDAPAFRSPPRVAGVTRSIKRNTDGSATVSVVVRDRPWNAVLGDMIEGFAAANHPDSAPRLRDLLWGVLETIELDADDTSGAHVITLPKVA